ncbi:Shedu anti-phage system protein SduA domain-containing protein [Streptomyces nigra]|uniref:Shedu anti-phage system protein SduA domain-containing protein n=1 Tax=Streptomyces nigra TaxID=1827580 RepID=UPI0036E44010
MTDERQVSRRQAQSQRVSFTDPIVIASTPQRRFEVLPQYIKRTDGDQVAAKLLYYKKREGRIFGLFPVEFTLNHEEVKELKRVLEESLAVAEGRQDGDFLVLRLDGTGTGLSGRDPIAVGKAIAPLVADEDVLRSLADTEDGAELLKGVQSSVRLTELSLAIGQLLTNLESGEKKEQTYQEWCERHGWVFGNAYTMRDEVRTIALGDSVDGLLAQTANGLRDIFELKRPDMPVISYDNTHKCWFWSRDVSMAIGQCHRYLDALHEAAARGLRDHPEVVAYHPRAILIIGRSHDWSEDQVKALHGLNARLHGISVMTYDQLLAQAEQLLSTLRG